MLYTTVSEEKVSANTHSILEVVPSPSTWLLLTLRPAWQIETGGSIECGTPVPWLSPGCRSSCTGWHWGFVQPCADRTNTWGVRLHVSCGAHGKTHHPGLTWLCWEGFFFSLCLWWGAQMTAQNWLHMLFLPLVLLFLSHFLFQMISLQTREDGVFAQNKFFHGTGLADLFEI